MSVDVSPAAVRAARLTAELTTEQAGALLGMSGASYRRYETDGVSARAIGTATWALYRARLALLAGDSHKALTVLREALPGKRAS